MKISDIRASLQRLAERLDNQWAYARSDAEMDIAAGRAEYNDDGERLPTEPEISYDDETLQIFRHHRRVCR